MLDTEILANDLEIRLNTLLKSIYENGDNILESERDLFWFTINASPSNYKNFRYLMPGKYPDDINAFSDTPTNRVVRYIQTEMQQTASDNENSGTGINAFISTQVNFVIPLININEEEDTLEYANSLKRVIDTVLSTNRNIVIEDDESVYSVGITYSLANTGSREMRPIVGDSIVLNAAIVYTIIDYGLNSTQIEITIDGINVSATHVGLSRVVSKEPEISTDSEGDAKHVVNGSTFTLSFEMPTRLDVLGDKIAQFIITNGKSREAHEVVVTIPSSEGEDITNTFIMSFDDVRINGEKTLNAATTVIMSELLDIEGIYDTGG